MASKPSDDDYLPSGIEHSVKLVVLGPFAVGKTTFVSSVSEIPPLRTEERMTRAGQMVDHLGHVRDKETTTVALDFGRLTLGGDIVLYLFGAPGQPRFQPLTARLLSGALGGLVLVDTHRIAESFDAIDRLEEAGLAYAIAVNQFDGAPHYTPDQLREALDLREETPLVTCDARHRTSAKEPLIALVTHLLSRPSLEPAT